MTHVPVRIGLIGYRGFGAFCTESFHGEEAGRVVAFAGRDLKAMTAIAELHNVPRTYTNWHALVADPDVELVHIVTPPDTHAEMAIAALKHGKHVFVEKPLAVSNVEADAILAAAQKAGKIAGINYVMRYDALYRIVAQITRQGWLGELTHVGFENYASDEGLNDDHWFWDPTQSGGIFVEHSVHFFDIIGHIVHAPAKRVVGQTWKRDDRTHKQYRVQATVTYANGVEATFYHAFNRPGDLERQTAHFAFERGHITLGGWIPNTLHLDALIAEQSLDGLRSLLPTLEIVQDHPNGKTVRGHGRDYPLNYKVRATERLGNPTDVYRRAVCDALADLVAALRNPAHHPLVTAFDGASSLRVALAARSSAETNEAVEVL
jgi:predicted dehydrogenase